MEVIFLDRGAFSCTEAGLSQGLPAPALPLPAAPLAQKAALAAVRTSKEETRNCKLVSMNDAALSPSS